MNGDLWLTDDEVWHWARHDLWRLKDAIMLIHGMKPNTEKGEWSRPNGLDGEAGYDDIMRMAKSANKAGRLTFKGEGKAWISPVEFIAWAKAKRLNVNSELERAVASFHQTGEAEQPVLAEQGKSDAIAPSTIETPPSWDTLTLVEKKASWVALSPPARREKAAELVKKHKGNKTLAAAEVDISRERMGQIIKEGKPEAPLPVNQWTQLAGLTKPKRDKASC